MSARRIYALEAEIQELAKRPVLDQGSGLRALRDALSNETDALVEVCHQTIIYFDRLQKPMT